MRDPEREEIKVSSKHVKLRIVLFVLALLIAVSAIAYGVSGLGRKTPGYYRVEAVTDEELIRLNGRVNFQYRFSGSNADINAALRQLQGVYAASLRRCWRLLDASETFTGVINPAELNANLGRDMQVSEELFEILTDAYAKTLEGEGYNLFAGPLYAEWNGILILNDPEPFDPSVNADEAARIARLASLVGDLSNFTFEIVDAQKHVLRFGVSEEVLACLRELELECPLLDLNLLHDAYLLRLIARDLEAQGYTNGYLETESGVTISLSGHSGEGYGLVGFDGEFREPAAVFPMAEGTACSLLRAFAPAEGSYGYYVAQTDAGALYRHPSVPASGEYPGVLLSCAVCCAEMDPVRAVYESLRLFFCADRATVEACAASLPDAAAWTLQDDGQRVYANAAAKAVLREADYGWTIE